MHLDQLHPRIQAVEPETGLLTRNFYRWLNQVWEKLGGPDDFIEETIITGTIEDNNISDTRLILVEQQLIDFENDVDMRNNATLYELQKQVEYNKRYCLMISS